MKRTVKITKKNIKWIVLLLCAAVGLFFVLKFKNSSKEIVRDQRTTVLIQKAKAGSLKKFLDLYGELKAENEVDLTSPVTGKILRFNRLEGSVVSKNQTIAYVDRFEVGARYAPAPVQTPVSGVVTRILVTEGADVSVGTPIASVGNINKLEARIQVPEAYAPEVKVGQKVFFQTRAVPDRTFEGVITRRDLSLNANTRSLTVRAEIINKDHVLFSGIFAESYVFVEEATNVYVVPESALTKTKEGKDAIFMNQNDIAVLRPVTVALRYRDLVALSEGVKDGDQLIVFGREYLSDGAPIRALEESSSEKSSDVVNVDTVDKITEKSIQTNSQSESSN